MRIYRYQGRDLKEALGRALSVHGAEAVVLAHEQLPDGRASISVGEKNGPELLQAIHRGAQRTLEAGGARAPGADAADAGIVDIQRRIAARGGSPALVAEVVAKLDQCGARGVHVLDAAARVLAELVPLAPSPKAVGCQVLGLIGPCGAGKTTTVAKLALRLARAGRKVLLASLPRREDALGSHAAGVAARLGLPHVLAQRPEDLLDAVASRAELSALLIDAPGCGAAETARIRALGRFLDTLGARFAVERYLILPATLGAEPAAALTSAYAALSPSAAVLTKLDETTTPAPVIEAARAAGLPLALLCDGAALAQHMRRPKADDVADLLLRGRLA